MAVISPLKEAMKRIPLRPTAIREVIFVWSPTTVAKVPFNWTSVARTAPSIRLHGIEDSVERTDKRGAGRHR
ncbi:MAG: hypothetical protein ACI9OJ_002369 [Myxococcota bacterium]|jgi:hypothetical protein